MRISRPVTKMKRNKTYLRKTMYIHLKIRNSIQHSVYMQPFRMCALDSETLRERIPRFGTRVDNTSKPTPQISTGRSQHKPLLHQ